MVTNGYNGLRLNFEHGMRHGWGGMDEGWLEGRCKRIRLPDGDMLISSSGIFC